MKYLNLNGKFTEAEEPILLAGNRSFRYGYGLFETMLIRNGGIQLKAYHWERLFTGMKELYFDIPMHFTASMLAEQVLRTVKRNNAEKLCRVRLQVFPGNGGLYDGDSYQPEYIIECFPLELHVTELNENGLVVGIAEGLSKSIDSLSHLKSCNALIYAAAARQAKQYKWNDALLYNTHGNIIESTIANIFWVKDGLVYSPPVSEGCISGVMRRHLMEVLKHADIQVNEAPLSKSTLLKADEAFLINAIRGIKWIAAIESSSYSNLIARRISMLLKESNMQ